MSPFKSVLQSATVSALLAVSACVPSPPPSPKLMERCMLLYTLWARYEHHPVFHHSGQKARAEYALYSCQLGNYEPGIQELEKMLRRGKFPIPPE